MASRHRSSFSSGQRAAIEYVERYVSILSLLAIFFMMGSFIAFRSFRKPINRLIVYATVANLMSNVAIIISLSGIEAGARSPLCQFQGFLIQWFGATDSLWTLCIALNIYFTFFKRYTAGDLRRLEKWYLIGCYGTMFLPALIYLLLDAFRDKNIYGPASLWCWVTIEWEWMRIAFFYGPVWISITLTIIIYVITGKRIFQQRAALRAFSKNPNVDLSHIQNPFIESEPSTVTKTTDIDVTSEIIRPPSHDNGGNHGSMKQVTRVSFSSTRGFNPYPATRVQQQHDQNSTLGASKLTSGPYTASVTAERKLSLGRTIFMDVEEPRPNPNELSLAQTRSNIRRIKAALRESSAVWAYTKVALLMFVANCVVWMPATINRIYSIAHPDRPLFALSIMAAAVLPLQGFWNCAIYVATSWPQCREAYSHICCKLKHIKRGVGLREQGVVQGWQPQASQSDQALSLETRSAEFWSTATSDEIGRQMSLQEAIDMDLAHRGSDLDIESTIPSFARPRCRGAIVDRAAGISYVSPESPHSPPEGRNQGETQLGTIITIHNHDGFGQLQH